MTGPLRDESHSAVLQTISRIYFCPTLVMTLIPLLLQTQLGTGNVSDHDACEVHQV